MTIAAIDIYNDPAPKRRNNRTVKPTMSELRAALKAADAVTFTDNFLKTQSRNDLIYAARTRGVTVNTSLQL